MLFVMPAATTEIYTLSLHDALPISAGGRIRHHRRWYRRRRRRPGGGAGLRRRRAPPGVGRDRRLPPRLPRRRPAPRSEEHTSELQSHSDLVCRLLLEKKKSTRTHVK